MGCGCGSKTNGVPPTFQVKMPNGEIKPYSSEIAALGKVKSTPGAVLLNPSTPPV